MTLKNTAEKIRRCFCNNENMNTEGIIAFEKMYPKFYRMLTNPNMDVEMYNKLFQMLDTIENNTTDEFTASTEFSTFGAEKYLYNTFGTPSQTVVENAKKKLKNH